MTFSDLKILRGKFFKQFLSPDLEFANKSLIATYLEKGPKDFERIIGDWFENGKILKEAFFKDLNLNNPAIEAEFQKHEAWKEKTQLRAIPTILVNGYKLPDNYKIEDLAIYCIISTSYLFLIIFVS